jgi:hypothetical protein
MEYIVQLTQHLQDDNMVELKVYDEQQLNEIILLLKNKDNDLEIKIKQLR